jgi:hypothetical protein
MKTMQTKRQPRVAALAKPASENPVALAGRQGFDDGYFRNDDEQMNFETEAERAAYDREFGLGRDQRKAADKLSRQAKR